jgi:threonine dehydrogenase-like Zn-dependent dehydrogenase
MSSVDERPDAAAADIGTTARLSALERVERGEINLSRIITHRVPLDRGPEMYRTFRDKHDGCVKVVLKP